MSDHLGLITTCLPRKHHRKPKSYKVFQSVQTFVTARKQVLQKAELSLNFVDDKKEMGISLLNFLENC